MKKHFIKTMLLALLCAVGGVGAAWADEVTVPTPVYFNDFSSTDGLTIVGSGEFITDADEHFGQIFHNDPSNTSAVRKNYLKLPADVFSSNITGNAITIGFWVNKKNEDNFWFAPLFGAYGDAPNPNNGAPMFTLETRGLLYYNTALGNDYCNFEAAQNDKKSNYEGTFWLDDGKWHYYTVTITETSAKVYIDGDVLNSWTLDNSTVGQLMTDFFAKLKDGTYNYICLGGNQAWDWNDADPAFGFDDFAVYDAALSAEQIAQIMTNKMADGEEVNNDITALPANYDFSTASSKTAPFDAGAIVTGKNINAFSVSNATATAYFDSNTETEDREPYTLKDNETVTVSFTAYHGWVNPGKSTVQLLNSDGVVLVAYTFNLNSSLVEDVTLGDATASGFEEFNGRSATKTSTRDANGYNSNSYQFISDDGYNPIVTMTVSKNGYVSFKMECNAHSISKEFSATLDAIKMDLATIKVIDTSTNADRSIGLKNLSITSEVVAKAQVDFVYQTTEGDDLSSLKTNSTQATIGTDIASLVTAAITETFYNEDNSVKYVYDSYTCSDETLQAAGTTVILKFKAYNKYTYTLNAVDADNNPLGEIATGSTYTDESLTLYWSKYIKFGEQWYMTNAPFGGTYTEAGTANITFTAADIYDFIECENTTYTSSFALNVDNNASNGRGVLLNAGKAMATKEKVAAGKYDISLYAYVRRANADKLTLQYSADGSAWTDVETLTFESSKAQTQIAYNVELAEDSYIRFVDIVNQNSCHYYDYIVIAPHHNTYTIKTSAGTVIAKGTCDEGQEYTVAVSEVVADGGKFYVLSDESVVNYTKTFTMGSGDEVQTINYAEDPTIVYYTEGTGISYMNEVAAEGYSAGNYVTVNTSANHGNARNRGYSVGNLAAGQYEITASIVGSNGRNICVRTNDGDYNSGNAPLVSLRNAGIRTGNFALGAEKAIVITGANNGDADGAKSGHMEDFDYIIIRKTSDVAAEIVNVTDAGYATYYSENPLDFTGTGLTAYIAEVNGSAVSFTEVTSVPAETGVLVKGDKGAYTVNVVSSSTDVSTNAFVGVLNYTKVENTGIYVLMNGANGVGFYKTTADAFTVSARTAYLPATASGRAFIGFDDETTGIKTVSNAAENNGMIFNLNGQRVSSPKGGLYIKNGKKVIIK